jgi:hypothetical protein
MEKCGNIIQRNMEIQEEIKSEFIETNCNPAKTQNNVVCLLNSVNNEALVIFFCIKCISQTNICCSSKNK